MHEERELLVARKKLNVAIGWWTLDGTRDAYGGVNGGEKERRGGGMEGGEHACMQDRWLDGSWMDSEGKGGPVFVGG